MYSKAKILGHPIHPLLITFPVAFYTTSFLAFAYYGFATDPDFFWYRVAYAANVAGIISALIAAVPGFIDWAVGIPNRTGAKTHGLVHMSLNLLALALFALNAYLYRGTWDEGARNITYAVILTGVGFFVTAAAGTYGWMLVSRHKVGVELTPEQELLEPVESLRPREPASERESSHLPV
jgi:uncharacterized membrane protein